MCLTLSQSSLRMFNHHLSLSHLQRTHLTRNKLYVNFCDATLLPAVQSCSGRILGADDLARPGLVFGSCSEVRDDHLHGLDLHVLGRDWTDLVRDLVSLHRNVLSLNVGDVYEDVLSAVSWSDEAMTLRPREVFTHALKDGTYVCSDSR